MSELNSWGDGTSVLSMVRAHLNNEPSLLAQMSADEQQQWEWATDEERVFLRDRVEMRFACRLEEVAFRLFAHSLYQGLGMTFALSGVAVPTPSTFPRHSVVRWEPQAPPRPEPETSPPLAGFPWFWALFPFLLPRAVRERVYEPCVEELKEDYLRERKGLDGPVSRRWVTFCFTVRTGVLFAQSLWAATGGTLRKVLLVALTRVLGQGAVAALRERLAEWFGRLL